MKDESEAENNNAVSAQSISDTDGLYSVDLMPGYYNVSIQGMAGEVLVYEYVGGKLTVDEGLGTLPDQNYLVEKKSITVSGAITSSYAGTDIVNVTVTCFNDTTQITAKDESNLTAGSYSLELFDGIWAISAESEQVNESGVFYIYKYSGGSLDANKTTTFNISLTKEAIDEES